jgi:hypothetical protein
MKSAVTEQCNALLKMFNSARDLIAEQFAKQSRKNWGSKSSLHVG